MNAQRAESTNRTPGGVLIILLALIGPPVLGIIFIPIFRTIQETFGPKGNLEGRDLTVYANRDTLMFKAFIAVLVVYALIISWRTPGWTFRTAALVLAGVMGVVTVAGVFFGLMAP